MDCQFQTANHYAKTKAHYGRGNAAYRKLLVAAVGFSSACGHDREAHGVQGRIDGQCTSDPPKAILALRWVVNEMEKRFQIFMRVGATRIGSFNARPKTNVVGSHEDDIVLPEKLSYVVVIIENVEDLIQVAKADIEHALEYLTQNGRAAGIHLVATTRQASRNTISERIAGPKMSLLTELEIY